MPIINDSTSNSLILEGESSNSLDGANRAYADIEFATQYLKSKLNSDAWDDATDTRRNKALRQATRMIDRLNLWGEKTADNQPTQFPRNDDTDFPLAVKQASVEIALALLDGVDPEIEFENLSMVSQGYGAVRSSFDRASPPEYLLAGIPSIMAWRLLKPFVRDSQTITLDRVS